MKGKHAPKTLGNTARYSASKAAPIKKGTTKGKPNDRVSPDGHNKRKGRR